jgi:hypothetical protein
MNVSRNTTFAVRRLSARRRGLWTDELIALAPAGLHLRQALTAKSSAHNDVRGSRFAVFDRPNGAQTVGKGAPAQAI